MEGECERVSDSVQPVHSWKESQMTEGRRACWSAAAMAGTIEGGSAMSEAVVAQNLRKPRRLMPCCRSTSAMVGPSIAMAPP